MAKGRMINKRLGKSKKYANLISDRTRVLYVLIYTHTDCEGRVDGDPEEIKIECCPYLKYTLRKIAESIIELHNIGLIQLYEIKGRPFIQFLEFEKNQPGLRKDREAESDIPEPIRSQSGVTPALYLSLNLYINKINKTIKGEEREQITFDFDKEKFQFILNEDIKRWKETYPAVDIRIELLKMEDWLLSNPTKKKKNYRRFITNWLSRCQEKGGTKKWEVEQDGGKIIGQAKPKKPDPPWKKDLDNATKKAEEKVLKANPGKRGRDIETLVMAARAKVSQEFWRKERE
jgi:hypothetical protein